MAKRADSSAVETDSADDPEAAGPRLGYHLRRRRRLKGLRLVDVAAAAGISPSLISKIEHNKISPSLSTLHRLARALDTSVAGLFPTHERRDPVILKREQRPVAGTVQEMVQWEGIEAEIIIPHHEHRLLEGFVFVMQPGGHSGGTLQHEGEECGYVLDGVLELTVAERTYRLGPGESFFFNSDIPHSYRNPGKSVARVIWVNTPPTF